MKNLTKEKAYSAMMDALAKRGDIGNECNRLREEINELLTRKKNLEHQHEKTSLIEAGDIKDWAAQKKQIKQITKQVEEKAERLQQIIDTGQEYIEEANRYKKQLYKVYFMEAEKKRDQLFSKLEEALKINKELKAYESQCWDPMDLARAGHTPPQIGWLDRLEPVMNQSKEWWDKMKIRVENDYPD